jgi:hypothetical protein
VGRVPGRGCERRERGLEEGLVRWGKNEGSVFVRFRGSEFYIYGILSCFRAVK